MLRAFFRRLLSAGVWAATGVTLAPGPLSGGDVPLSSLGDFEGPAPHPTMIVAEVDGKSYPVTSVSGEFAQVIAGTATKTLRSSRQTYRAMRAADYAPGSVDITNMGASSLQTIWEYHEAHRPEDAATFVGNTSFSGTFDCAVTAKEDHPDCYVVVLFYQVDADGRPKPDSVALGFGRLGDLKAGRAAKAHIARSYTVPGGTKFFLFPMVFSRGRELRSNQSGGEDHYFGQQEASDHIALIAEYLTKFKGADHAAVPFVQVPLRLPAGIDSHSLPTDLKATFWIDEEGNVGTVELPDGLDPAVRRALTHQIQCWLFLPRLKHGDPVPSRIALPIGFN